MSVSFQVHAEQANVNIEEGTVILTGIDPGDLVSEIGYVTLLQEMEFSDIHDYVIEQLKESHDE